MRSGFEGQTPAVQRCAPHYSGQHGYTMPIRGGDQLLMSKYQGDNGSDCTEPSRAEPREAEPTRAEQSPLIAGGRWTQPQLPPDVLNILFQIIYA